MAAELPLSGIGRATTVPCVGRLEFICVRRAQLRTAPHAESATTSGPADSMLRMHEAQEERVAQPVSPEAARGRKANLKSDLSYCGDVSKGLPKPYPNAYPNGGECRRTRADVEDWELPIIKVFSGSCLFAEIRKIETFNPLVVGSSPTGVTPRRSHERGAQ